MKTQKPVALHPPRRRGPAAGTLETRAYTLLLEPEIADAAKREGSLSELVRSLLRSHYESNINSLVKATADLAQRRKLTGRGFLAGQPGSVDEFIARKAEEKALEQ